MNSGGNSSVDIYSDMSCLTADKLGAVKNIYLYCFVEFATVTQHGERRWNRTNVPIDINPFITIPPYERLSGFEPSTSRSADQALIQLS